MTEKNSIFKRYLNQSHSDGKCTAVFFMIVVSIGLIAACLNAISVHSVATCLLWIMACLTFGGAIGFLFGIPKILQSNNLNPGTSSTPNEKQDQYRQQVNTNLTEISDWLTKIIIGLGLINLTKIPPYLSAIADTLSRGVNPANPNSSLAFAYGLIICYSVLGFLFGYLITRLFLAGAFSRADQQAVNVSNLEFKVASIETNQSLLANSLYPSKKQIEYNISLESNGHQSGSLKQLQNLAADYLKINKTNNPDWSERVCLKDKAANEMGRFILANEISKDDLASLAEKTNNEALILALAMVVNLKPERADVRRLLNVSRNVGRLHVRYRVLLAIGTLFKLKLIDADQLSPTLNLIESYRRGADDSLIKLIDSTYYLIQTSAKIVGSSGKILE